MATPHFTSICSLCWKAFPAWLFCMTSFFQAFRRTGTYTAARHMHGHRPYIQATATMLLWSATPLLIQRMSSGAIRRTCRCFNAHRALLSIVRTHANWPLSGMDPRLRRTGVSSRTYVFPQNLQIGREYAANLDLSPMIWSSALLAISDPPNKTIGYCKPFLPPPLMPKPRQSWYSSVKTTVASMVKTCFKPLRPANAPRASASRDGQIRKPTAPISRPLTLRFSCEHYRAGKHPVRFWTA